MRIGIASGLVVVGDLVGTGEAQEQGIFGETSNLAARLQALAEANAIIVADGTCGEISAAAGDASPWRDSFHQTLP